MRRPLPTVTFRSVVPSDRSAVEALLTRERLPLDGVAEHFATFVVAESGAERVGAGGLELHGTFGLVRSVVVAPDVKGHGVGKGLAQQLLSQARARGLEAVYCSPPPRPTSSRAWASSASHARPRLSRCGPRRSSRGRVPRRPR
jgi:GNAT superfamily N-acetyltransferase